MFRGTCIVIVIVVVVVVVVVIVVASYTFAVLHFFKNKNGL